MTSKNSGKILTADIMHELAEFQTENNLPKFGSKLSAYEVLGHLGRGATANVYKVRMRDAASADDFLALKVIDKAEVRKKNLQIRVKNEVEIHIHLNRA